MKKILSLDGGGVKGIRTLQALKTLEAVTQKPTYHSFDVITGTSTGALIALALSLHSAADVERAYLAMCPKVFSKSVWRSITTLGGAAGAKYDATVLKMAVQVMLPQRYSIPAKAFVASFDTQTWQPVVLSAADLNWDAWQAALASSAAPTYFDPFVGPDGKAYWDGGVVNNNPALTAMAFAGIQPAEALVLSLGTGSSKMGYPTKTVQTWKPLEMIGPALSSCMDGSVEQNDSSLRHLLPSGQYLRVQAAFNNDSMDDANEKNLTQLQTDGVSMVETSGLVAQLRKWNL